MGVGRLKDEKRPCWGMLELAVWRILPKGGAWKLCFTVNLAVPGARSEEGKPLNREYQSRGYSSLQV